MNCKNCQTPQRTDFIYCPNCGARVIHNRLTFKNLWYDITEQYFNLDNSFLKTVKMLCIKPEVVIEAYFSGVRRKFLNPMSHLGIALTLSGLLLFIMQKVFSSEMIKMYNQDMSSELSAKLTEAIFDYSTFIFILLIPVFALGSYLSFNQKNYVLTEHIVGFVYILSQYTIITFPISLGVLLVAPESYFSWSFPMLFLMFGYSLFVVQRINRFSIGPFILRALVFLMLSGIGYFGIIILFYILLFLTGTVTLQDFAPPK